ncbi:MAG: hypothetical protein IT374_27670 [Polyangiaceae bacterium]|nr:hypothetical protein [Polyangiaceae bacterium]
MATRKEIVDELAARIRAAASLSEAKVASVGRPRAAEGLGDEVLDVVRVVEDLQWTGGHALSGEEIDELLGEVDSALGVRPGTLRLIKEGSIVNLLQYNQLLTQLMSALARAR